MGRAGWVDGVQPALALLTCLQPVLSAQHCLHPCLSPSRCCAVLTPTRPPSPPPLRPSRRVENERARVIRTVAMHTVGSAGRHARGRGEPAAGQQPRWVAASESGVGATLGQGRRGPLGTARLLPRSKVWLRAMANGTPRPNTIGHRCDFQNWLLASIRQCIFFVHSKG